jgi:hypothetical protein
MKTTFEIQPIRNVETVDRCLVIDTAFDGGACSEGNLSFVIA